MRYIVGVLVILVMLYFIGNCDSGSSSSSSSNSSTRSNSDGVSVASVSTATRTATRTPTRTPRKPRPTATPTARHYGDDGFSDVYITDDGRLLFDYNPAFDKYAKTKATATPTPTPVLISIEKLADDITAGYEVNGSDIFKSRINDAIYGLSKHDATFELIRRAGYFTITESSTPCHRSYVEGCAVLGPQKIELKNHADPRWMKIVLVHEIAHLALGPSECVAGRAEIDYMNSNPQYNGYHMRSLIEDRVNKCVGDG